MGGTTNVSDSNAVVLNQCAVVSSLYFKECHNKQNMALPQYFVRGNTGRMGLSSECSAGARHLQLWSLSVWRNTSLCLSLSALEKYSNVCVAVGQGCRLPAEFRSSTNETHMIFYLLFYS